MKPFKKNSMFINTPSKLDWKKPVIIIQLLLIPVLLHIFWQMLNNELPNSDGGDHYRIAYMIYLSFKDGFSSGVSYFFHTGGKPILFSAFAAPFISISNTNLQLSIILTLVMIQTVTIFAYYWLFSLRIKPFISALLAITFTTTPFVFSIQTQFMPEVMWHMWFVLFLATLFRTNNLIKTNLTFLAGIFLGLTILARPVESVILISPTLSLYFYYLYRENVIGSLLKFSWILIIAAFSFIVCFQSSIKNFDYLYGIYSIIFMVIILTEITPRLSFKRHHFVKTSSSTPTAKIGAFLLPISLLCSGWVLFYGNALLGWMHDNSFGEGAKLNDQVNLHKSVFIIFKDVLSFYGTLPILTLLIMFISTICLCINKKAIDLKPKVLIFGTAAVFLTLTPMLYAYSLTGTSDMRRIFLGVIFLMVMLSFAIFQKNYLSKGLEFCYGMILTVVLCIQLFAIITNITGNSYLLDKTNHLINTFGALNYRAPRPTKSEDATVVHTINSLGITKSKIAVFSLGMFSTNVFYQAESLRYVTLSIDRSLTFSTLWGYAKYEPYKDVIKRLLANNFDYVLLEDLDDAVLDPVSRERLQSHTFFIRDLLSAINRYGETNLPNLALVKKFKIGDRYQYFFKVYDPHRPLISCDSQLDSYGPEGLLDSKQPGWHATLPSVAPHFIHVDLTQKRLVSSLGFLPQDGNAIRGPKNIRIEASNDDITWIIITNPANICNANAPEGWHNLTLEKPITARFLKIVVLKNCGDPGLVTLKGLKIS